MVVHKDNLNELAQSIIDTYPNHRIFILDGEMGAGKTTLSTEFANVLGALDHPSSPTFSIVNIYLLKDGSEMFHFDFYRMEKVEEAFEIGVEEYFYSGNYCFIEWPNIVEKLLPESVVRIKIQHAEHPEDRMIEVSANN